MRVLDCFMHLMSFDVDGAEGTAGAEVLAGSAADATLLIDNGNLQADVAPPTVFEL